MNTHFDLMQERITNGVALGAVSSPFWIESLEGASSLAGHLLPILGCAWLIVQMISHYKTRGRK